MGRLMDMCDAMEDLKQEKGLRVTNNFATDTSYFSSEIELTDEDKAFIMTYMRLLGTGTKVEFV